MKEQTGKKSKLWLWLLLALVALIAAAGVTLAFVLPGDGGQEGSGEPQTVQSELYWNIDGAYFMEISEVPGTSAREVGEDGFYHIVFLVNGERKELLVADKRLVNYIDSMQLMGLVFDENGNVIDALDVKTVATEVAKEFFVKKLENGVLIINSSRAMNGMPMEIVIDENASIFDMTLAGDELGNVGTPEQMDKVNIYQSLDGTKTYVYIVEKAPEISDVYWRVARCWDATAGKTTRVPDENGVYTLEFACEGELVELKCKDAVIVGTIDSSAVLTGQFAFEFDEEGYIIGIINVPLATRSIYAAGDYHVTEVNGDTFTVTRLSSGSDQGKMQTLKLAEKCDIYQCCQFACYDDHCGQRVDSVQLGDRVNVYTNLDGEAILIFVTRRLYGGPMYYNFNRQYGGNMEVGTLRQKTGGYYVFEMLCEGKVVEVKVKDKKLADQMESIYNRCMGLDVDEKGVVTRLYDATCVYGGAVLGTESFVTSLTGPVIVVASSTSDTTWNSILSDTCKVYNVIQGEYGAKIGGELTLQEGDQITAFRNNREQLEVVFVMSRPVSGGKVYYNLQRKYNSTTQETNRVPNEEGYYEYLFASEGKQVTAKTKSKGLASFIDAQTAPLVGLKINKNGIITNAYVVTSVLKQSSKACNYRYVENVKKSSFNTFYYPSATPDKKTVDTTTWKIAKNCKVYNVSTAVTNFRGEKSTLKNGDYIQAIKDLKTGEITQIWIMNRNPAYGVKNYEAYCEHCDQKVTWEPYIGKVVSGTKHYFLFTDMFYAQASVGTKAEDDATFDTVLDLNGKTLNGDGRCFLVYDHLTIMDSKGGGKLMGTNPSSNGDKHSGGCIMVAGGKLDILSGTLGQSEKSTEFGTIAGVIYLAGGVEVNMYGGTLMNGTTTVNGGCVGNYGGTFNMYGGEIKGGQSPLGANIYSSSGTINLMGGTVDGGIEVSNSTTLKLSGKLTITGTGIKVPAGKKLDPTALDPEARIAVTATGIFTEAYDNIADYQPLFTTVLEEDKIVVRDNALSYISSGPSDFVLDTDNDGMAVCPACNQDVAWMPVTGRLGASMTGHYYLNADINDNSSQWATITAKGSVLCIHMNGHNLTTSGRIAVVGNGGTINIMGDGTITGEGDYVGTDAESYTRATLVATSGAINLYGNVKVTTTAAGKPVVFSRVGFSINDNAIIEGNDECVGIESEKNTVTLNGGTITGGILANGGTVVLGGNTTVDIIGIQTAAKLKVLGSWTGAADSIFANPMVDGVVPIENGESTGEFTGTLNILDLETGAPTQLFGKGGKLATADAQVTPKEPDFVLDPDGDGKAVCPACGGAEVTWTPLAAGQRPGTSASGHFYLLEGGTNTDAQYATTTTKEHKICLHLNGKDVTTTGRIATVGASGGSINIMGKGTINSLASSDYAEATLVISSGGSISLYDDVTVTIAADGKPTVEIRNNSTLNLMDNAKIVAKEGGVGILNKGKLFLNDATTADNITVESSGKVTVNGNWTGSAKVSFAAALEAGVVPAANGASTGAFTGSLTMDGQKLVGSDGKLMLEGAAPSDPVDPPAPPATEGELVLDSNNQAMCPACQKVVTWTAVTKSLGDTVVDGGHYYLTGNYDNPYQFMTVTKTKTVCFHNNGYTLTYPSRIFVTGATLNLMGSGQVISKTTTEDQLGAVVAAWANGVINIYGGTYSTENDAPALKLHGDMTVKVNVYGDTVIESADIHKGTLTLYGNSRIENINVQSTGKLVIDSSWTGSAKVTFAAALVEGVVPEANGASTGDFTGTLTMGEEKLVAKDGGLALESVVNVPEAELVLDADGNGYCDACQKTVKWTDLHTTTNNRIGWLQDDAAADIHYHFYLSADMDNQKDLQFAELYNNTTCLHTNGFNLKIRSRLRMGSGATMNVLGSGSISTDSSATNTNYNNALFFINSTAKLNIYGGTYSTAGVPVLMINDTKACQINLFDGVVVNGGAELKNGTLTLDGNATITSINLTANAKLVVNAGWSGTAVATFASPMVDGAVPATNGASTGAFTGKLIVEGKELIGKDGLLKVDDVDPQVAKGKAVAAAAAEMDFSTYQAGTAVQCPVCQKDVTWEPINGLGKAVVDGGHYYVNKDITGDGICLTISGKVVCVHLNGKNLTYGARIFATSANSTYPGTLNLMGNGTVSSSNAHADYGTGTIHAASAGIINLYGGTYKSTGANTKATVHTTGGTVNIYSGATIDSNTGTNVLLEKGTVNLYGGTIKNGTGFLSGSNRLGGNVYLRSGNSVFNLVDGLITGGTATYGGNVRAEAGNTFTMNGGQITDGNGSNGGGNINSNGTATINAGIVSGGVTTNQGGNIMAKGVVTIGKNATISGGKAKEGGNIQMVADEGTTSTLNTAGIIFGGVTEGSAAHGGNISGGSRTIINITDGKIYNGTAAGQAGNVRTYNGTLNISGGEIYGGISLGSTNHNVWAAGDSGVLTFTGGTIKGMDGVTANGTAVTIGTGATLNLGGSATALRDDGINKSLLYVYNGKLNVMNDWTGSASVKFASSYTAGATIPATTAQCGAVVENVFTAGGSYTGILMNEFGDAVKILGINGALVLDQLPAAE